MSALVEMMKYLAHKHIVEMKGIGALRAWPKARAGDNSQQMLGVGSVLRYSNVPKCTAWKSIFPSSPPSPVSLRSRNQKGLFE